MTTEHRLEPLHQSLFSFGKGWLQWPGSRRSKPSTRILTQEAALQDDLEARLQAITVHQLTTSLRMQGATDEDDTMLSSLESLVMAGEIPFSDFIGRVQNLFPKAMEALDVSLRMKIASLLLQSR